MKFEMVEEKFGSKLQPYSNNPKTDVECILARIEELKSNASSGTWCSSARATTLHFLPLHAMAGRVRVP